MTPLSQTKTTSFLTCVKTVALVFAFSALGPITAASGQGLPLLIALTVLFYIPFWVVMEKPFGLKGAFQAMSWPVIFLLAFLSWTSLSFFWSPYSGTKTLWMIWLAFFVSNFFLKMVCTTRPDAQKKIVMAFLVSLSVLAVFLLVEISFNFPFTQWLKGHDTASIVNHIFLKASMIFTILTGPALALAWSFGGKWRLLGAGLVIAAGFSAFMLPMAANALGFVLGILGFGTGLLWPKRLPPFLLVITALIFVIFPFLMIFFPEFFMALQAKLPYSWAQRLEIWHYVSNHMMDKPFLGWGLKASRACEDTVLFRGEIVRAILFHPHNASAQVWYETGMIGVGLIVLSLLALARKLKRIALTPLTSASISAVIVTISVPGFLSFDIWHEWWWATAVFAGAACCLVFLAQKQQA